MGAFGVLTLEDSDADETFSRLRRGMEKALEETYMNKQLPTFLNLLVAEQFHQEPVDLYGEKLVMMKFQHHGVTMAQSRRDLVNRDSRKWILQQRTSIYRRMTLISSR